MDAVVGCSVSTPGGGSFALEDPTNGFELHEETAGTRATTQRVTSSDGVATSGTYAHRSTRGNVVEPLSLWITGTSNYDCQAKVKAVQALFNQLRYTVTFRFGDLQETWNCFMPADYTETYDKPFRFATTCLLRLQVPRHPDLVIAQVA